MINEDMRQAVTGTLLVLDLVLIAFLSLYLLSVLRCDGWRTIRDRMENQAALALLTLISGLAIIRGWTLILLWLQEHGRGSAWDLEQRYPVALLGLAIAVVGKVCMIRVFSRESWGHWGWIGGLIAAGAFVSAVLAS